MIRSLPNVICQAAICVGLSATISPAYSFVEGHVSWFTVVLITFEMLAVGLCLATLGYAMHHCLDTWESVGMGLKADWLWMRGVSAGSIPRSVSLKSSCIQPRSLQKSELLNEFCLVCLHMHTEFIFTVWIRLKRVPSKCIGDPEHF
eukprot:SAG11_NODE_3066_length_2715_cov_1.813838_5_plen_147_part_00